VPGAEYKQRKLEFWQDVYGVNMRAMKESVVSTAHLGTVKADRVVTSACTLLHLDLAQSSLQQTEFTVPFELAALQDCTVSMLVAYFDVDFAAGEAPSCVAPHPIECTPWIAHSGSHPMHHSRSSWHLGELASLTAGHVK
jgi:hypothetical protein